MFALPDPQNRQLPKCKSESARSSAYDLLVELVKETPKNYEYLYKKLLEQHSNGKYFKDNFVNLIDFYKYFCRFKSTSIFMGLLAS